MFYNYAATTYHGNTSGNAQRFRGNHLNGDDWDINGTTGNFTTTGNISSSSYEAITVGSNAAPTADDARLGGYGVLGNRVTFYVSNAGGQVALNHGGTHGNNVKLQTTTTGVAVTGNVVATQFQGQATNLSVSSSSSTSFYNMMWHSGTNAFSTSSGGGFTYRPSDGFSKIKHGYLGGNSLAFNTSGQVYPTTTTSRTAGMYGIYDSTKKGHIWSMGTAYKIAADGSTFGNLYGFGYQYDSTNSHQAVWCINGSIKAVIGQHMWSSGNITAVGNIFGAEVTETSALKYKDITRRVPLEESLDNVLKIGQLGAAIGTLKADDTNKMHRWFIADEVAKVVPEAVNFNDEGEVEGLSYTRLLPDAYAAIAKQQEIIETLMQRISVLEEKLNG